MPSPSKRSKRKQEVLERLSVVHGRWPFPDPPNTGCYVSCGLMDGSTAVESVVHDHDGDWSVLDGTDPVADNLMFVCLEDVVRRHPVVGAVGKLPVGWRADMDFEVPEWEASPLGFDTDGDG